MFERSHTKDAPLVEFMYIVFTRVPGKSYCRRLRSLLCLCDVFRALTPLCLDCARALWASFCFRLCLFNVSFIVEEQSHNQALSMTKP